MVVLDVDTLATSVSSVSPSFEGSLPFFRVVAAAQAGLAVAQSGSRHPTRTRVASLLFSVCSENSLCIAWSHCEVGTSCIGLRGKLPVLVTGEPYYSYY